MPTPKFQPTKAMREEVLASKALGMADDKIALALGIARGTLLKYFADELGVGAAKRQMKTSAALFRQVDKGNVAAIKYALTLIQTAQAGDKGGGRAEPPGKKEQAAEAAKTAGVGTDWGDDLTVAQARAN